ncbi:MAG: sigma-70 family RNA polymerase sigma factor [Labilithrix sp.]|nr:sigma-70 family RNA polymerase sigma factor [Labilithrix sp.]MCW5833716.1 sigma-70 family RNA polymerase sigma factor [Labilithrix sp.]
MGDAARAREAVALARAALPSLAVSDAILEEHVLRWMAGGAPQLELVDLVLARACAAGDPAALAHFDATYRSEMIAALSTLRAPRDFVDEVMQSVREKLFVGPSPKILEYGGRGALRAWLRAVVVRSALNARRRRISEPKPSADDDRLLDVAAASSGDPEIAEIVAKYGDTYKRAVHEALAELTTEDRNILRLSLLEGLSIDGIAQIYGVHRATVARRIARARESVAEGARRRLGERTRLDLSELASVTRACRTELDLSLVRALERP